MPALVPEGFVIPRPLVDGAFRFEPLGTRHNVEDHLAWTSSIEHIQRTPGFAGRHWPGEPETLDENLLGLAQHEEDFTHRRGFAYAVRDVLALEYVGCVYFYRLGHPTTTSTCGPGCVWSSRILMSISTTQSVDGLLTPGPGGRPTTPVARCAVRSAAGRRSCGTASRCGSPCGSSAGQQRHRSLLLSGGLRTTSPPGEPRRRRSADTSRGHSASDGEIDDLAGAQGAELMPQDRARSGPGHSASREVAVSSPRR